MKDADNRIVDEFFHTEPDEKLHEYYEDQQLYESSFVKKQLVYTPKHMQFSTKYLKLWLSGYTIMYCSAIIFSI